jgi:hypothetical protein
LPKITEFILAFQHEEADDQQAISYFAVVPGWGSWIF